MSQATSTPVNPFASPSVVTATSSAEHEKSSRPRTLSRVFWIWLVTCSIAAAPSFYFGLILGHTPVHLSGMLAGVAVFIAALTYLDYFVVGPRLRGDVIKLRMLKTLKFGYGTRVFISVVAPIAFFFDMFLGLLSIRIVGLLPVFHEFMKPMLHTGQGDPVSPPVIFAGMFLTTIVQGILLNLALAVYMSVVWLVMTMMGIPAEALPPKTLAEVEDERDAQLAALSGGAYEELTI